MGAAAISSKGHLSDVLTASIWSRTQDASSVAKLKLFTSKAQVSSLKLICHQESVKMIIKNPLVIVSKRNSNLVLDGGLFKGVGIW
jgi:hypothetical protein